MSRFGKTSDSIKINERNHVEEPFLDQLRELGWEIIDLKREQKPGESFRETFRQVVMEPKLRESLIKINDWLEKDQIDEVIRRMTEISKGQLLENNKAVLNLLLEGTSVPENQQTGEKSPTVKYIDFDELSNNFFIAVCQLKVRIPGTEKHIIPDIVLFVNGLPLVVIEAKSPKRQEPKAEAIDQLLRYSNQRGEAKEGSEPLFYYNQFVVATCRQEASFGTISSRIEKHFYRWTDPYPKTVDEIATGASAPNDQQRLAAGMLEHRNLLDLIKIYSIFVVNDEGKTIKIVARYQQFRAVKKAIQQLNDGRNRDERGGIVWHTQGSGKSYTMMFMVREMSHDDKLKHWKVVFITDRTQLEEQLSETSVGIGYTVKVPGSSRELKEMLPGDSSDLIMAMIQKFQERDFRHHFPELNASENILIMIDEAHRSQYELLGANMDKALPNATRIVYTGTPIEQTERTFGSYLDKYSMRKSIDDKVTLEIVYEGRTHKAEIEDRKGAEEKFEDVFSEYNIMERLRILGFTSKRAYMEAEDTIRAKAKDMIQNYVHEVFPNGYKAQLVAYSQEAAVRYYKFLKEAVDEEIKILEDDNPYGIDIEKLKSLKTAVVISSQSTNERPHIREHTNSDDHKNHVASFKLPFGKESDEGIKGDVGILIVHNMLITGFDAPIEQVMYLDRVMKSHNLLQAIARVNRVYDENKKIGRIVDYVGVGHHLKEAVDYYDELEQKDILDSLIPFQDEYNKAVDAQRNLNKFFEKQKIDDLSDYDSCFDLFYDEDIRFEFITLYREFTKGIDTVFPRKEALDFMDDYLLFAEINVMAGRHFHDSRMSMTGIPDKMRSVTDEFLKTKGIDVKVEPISIMDEDFQSNVKKRKSNKTKAAEVEHAMRHFLEINIDDDPDLYASFVEAMEEIMTEFANNWSEIYRRLEELRQKIRNASKQPTYGLDRKKKMPFFRSLRREIFGETKLDDEQIAVLVRLTETIYDVIEREIQLTEFWDNTPAQNRLKMYIQEVILSEEFINLPNIRNSRSHIFSRMMEIAQNKHDTILYSK